MKLSSPGRYAVPRVPMAPLIDVVFLVLAVFIEASLVLTRSTVLPIDLPAAGTAERDTDPRVVRVTVSARGEVYLDDQPVTLAALERALSDRRQREPDLVVRVEADRRATVEPLVRVLDLARRAGVRGLTLAAEVPADDKPPPP